jgi:SAM-dependent methyltransferase
MSVANRDQAEHWNSSEQAAHWVSHQEQYDRMLAPFTDMILGAAALSAGDNVLDVGCGCGSTTLAAAEVAAPGAAVGVDLSAPMLARARDSAPHSGLVNASFEQGDAQDHRFGQVFDVVISRFGVMFFADPVAAFTNLRAATRPRGRMAFVCWQPLIANEWLMIAGAAFAERVRLPDPPEPDAPGMFSLAEPSRIQGILGDAGWSQVTLTSRETPILLGGSVDDAVAFLRNGSLGRRVLDGADAATQTRAIESLRRALARRARPGGVRLGAAAWLVQARS